MPSLTDTLVALVMVGATSVTVIVTAWLLVAVPSEARTLKLYELFVSKSGEVLNFTAPVEALTVNAPASAPPRLRVTTSAGSRSVALATYTTVEAAMPSATVALVLLVIVGAWFTQPTSMVMVFGAASNRAASLTLKSRLAYPAPLEFSPGVNCSLPASISALEISCPAVTGPKPGSVRVPADGTTSILTAGIEAPASGSLKPKSLAVKI